jgi:CheY-like chemotaxis protein
MSKIRVLVVDDAVVVRRLLAQELSSDPALEVVGTAANGRIALARMPQVNPDVVILDVEMPEMDGLATLAEIRKTYRHNGQRPASHRRSGFTQRHDHDRRLVPSAAPAEVRWHDQPQRQGFQTVVAAHGRPAERRAQRAAFILYCGSGSSFPSSDCRRHSSPLNHYYDAN